MATELGEGVEDTTRDNTRTITGDKDCLTSEAIERKNLLYGCFFLFLKKINLKRYV